jgi:peptidoglycan biosynthesis protein MviN/MurJ (putative lipid II flippase)
MVERAEDTGVRDVDPPASMRRGIVQLLAGGMFGKVTGVAREVLLAAVYGTSTVTASLRIAQTATLIPFNLMTSDALNSGFLPIFGRYRRDKGVAAADEFYRSFRMLTIMVALLVSLLLLASGDYVVQLLAPGLSSHAQRTAAGFLRVMAL